MPEAILEPVPALLSDSLLFSRERPVLGVSVGVVPGLVFLTGTWGEWGGGWCPVGDGAAQR